MNEDFLRLYESELRYIRKTAWDFAQAYPKIAGRLAIDREKCEDPFAERLLEGFAFLTARVRHKMEAEFPTFTQSLFETVYPDYLCPTPSMAIAKFTPERQLQEHHRIPRGTVLRGHLGHNAQTQCQYTTAHNVDLWPVDIASGGPDNQPRYFTRDIDRLSLPPSLRAKAALRLRLRTAPDIENFQALEHLDSLVFFLSGEASVTNMLYEEVFGRATHILVKSASDFKCSRAEIYPVSLRDPRCPLKMVGFGAGDALLPAEGRSFDGYRLLKEYFTLPQRFHFFELRHLAPAIAKCAEKELDIIFVFDHQEPRLDGTVDRSCFELFCSPILNVFRMRTDHVPVSDRFSEFHLVVDRTRTLDYEIYAVENVTGYGIHSDERFQFRPFYRRTDRDASQPGFFTVRREPRHLTAREQQFHPVSKYVGSEVFVGLVDQNAAPYSPNLQELGATVKCTNRHLPLQMPIGSGETDFFTEGQTPLESIRCLVRPTAPLPSFAEGTFAWRLSSHLSLNYLSLLDGGNDGAAAMREMLSLYDPNAESDEYHWIHGIKSIQSRPIVRRSLQPGPVAFAKGLEVAVEVDETNFVGRSSFLMGAVLDRFFANYVSINSFTETAIKSLQRGRIMSWPAQVGNRHLL